MESLSKLQFDVVSNITSAKSNFKKSPKERITVSYVEARLEMLEKLWSSFYTTHRKIVAEISQSELSKSEYYSKGLYNSTEEFYLDYKVDLKECLNKLNCKDNSHKCESKVSNSENGSQSIARLPKVRLPTFSGKYTEWTNFRNLFISLIHNNKSLEDVDRLNYLKGHLTGEAEQLLRHDTISGENYAFCWTKLDSEYNNKKYLANSILARFMGQNTISSESSSALKDLLFTSNDCLNALKQLGVNVEAWDIIVIYILSLKLDNETRKAWELKISNPSDDLPTWKLFREFLEQRFHGLENLDFKNSKGNTGSRNTTNKVKAFHVNTDTCPHCKANHKLFSCQKFAKDDVATRRKFVQTQGLCFNCLGPHHSVIKCRSSTRCRICNRKHHSLLHCPQGLTSVDSVGSGEQRSTSGAVSNLAKDQADSNKVITSCFSKMHSQVLLATALVNIESLTGLDITFRSMLDQGSQATFITESAVQLLGLKKIANKTHVSVLGSDSSSCVISKHVVLIKLKSLLDSKVIIRVKAHVLNKLTNVLPSKKVSFHLSSQFTHLSLADPSFNVPNRVDLIIGANIYAKILKRGLIKDPSSCLIAQNTSLGWVISGETSEEDAEVSISCNEVVVNMHVQLDENDLLRQFWEMESEPSPVKAKRFLTKEEQICEEIYASTTTRNASGRYIVKLPFREKHPKCIESNSKQIALKRQSTLERKLSKEPELKKKYSDVFTEYLSLGHMEVVPQTEREKEDVCYLPHLPVIRNDKITTQVRIVFDASCQYENGVSLNNELMVGPTLQADLRHILMRWRVHPICLGTDIVKMYRQVLVSREDVDFQRILWREDPTSEVEHYRLLTVTFGTSSAPYLAVRTLQQLARDEGGEFPRAAEVVLSDSYVDDILSGSENVSEAKQLYLDLKQLLSRGGFQLQKWISNNEELMHWMKDEEHSWKLNNETEDGAEIPETIKTKLDIRTDTTTKMLGLGWERHSDAFKYTVKLPALCTPVTKRMVISEISRLYDPLGWLAPIIIKAKIFIQRLWISGIKWDEELTPDLLASWISYRQELESISTFEIPRWMSTRKNDTCVQLHGFCDASSEAIAAAVYIRIIDVEGCIHVHLVASKTKVAPIRQISIPRLELCGAVLLSKLLVEVSDVLEIPKHQVHAWTDSSVVLAWLSNHPNRWKVFVANRVSEILSNLDRSQWSHVKSKENPADCASRGAMPTDVHQIQLWKTGPAWLKEKEINYGDMVCDTNTEAKAIKVCQVMVGMNHESIWERFSTLRKLVRVLTWCRRFMLIGTKRNSTKLPRWLTSKELQETLITIVKQCQSQGFNEEMRSIAKHGTVKRQNKLTPLNPFTDEAGVLRVGGRLNQALLSKNQRHPMILPAKSHLTGLIIADSHEKTIHGGPQIMLNYLRSRYWIIDAKNQVKQFVRNCVVCVRHAAKTREQLMGQMPICRITPGRPFKRSGVDYAGPFSIRTSKGRGHHAYKGYICLFVCMVTRAIHLEVVSDLTAKGFLAAFKRFVARRGHCAELFSDNGTNFVGAARELKSLLTNERSGIVPEIANWLSSNGTEWHFIPPHSPNFGGLWEAGVRSTKHHLRRVIGNSTLTFEELSTVLAQIEACLNSRPMTSLSTTSADPMPLTPGHFLIGEPLILVPEANYESSNISSLKRWQLTQRMVQNFWKKWSQEYLTQFLHRYKWQYQTPEPNIGDIVLVKEDGLPPARWLYGIITDKHPGLDKITRVVSLKCNGNIIKRPVSKLCILPVAR